MIDFIPLWNMDYVNFSQFNADTGLILYNSLLELYSRIQKEIDITDRFYYRIYVDLNFI